MRTIINSVFNSKLPEEKIARDLLTRGFFGEKYSFSTPADEVKVIGWLSQAIKNVLNIAEFKKLPSSRNLSAQSDVEPWSQDLVLITLATNFRRASLAGSKTDSHLSTHLRHPELLNNFPLKFEEYDGEPLLMQFFRALAHSHTVNYYHVQPLNVNDDDAIKVLTEFISIFLKENLTNLHALKKAPITVMCINRFCKNSLFGTLPRDVAKIVAQRIKNTIPEELRNLDFRK